ncbi:MAG TPA: FAD-dependent oxidoreductase, partial [Anaerolineae bacterium]|nr:FAD-dependent oxidoreductase [Anaerolineae bacterium]
KPGSGVYELYRELGTAQASHWPDVTTYGRFVDEASGRTLLVTTDLQRLRSDLHALFPGDGRLIDSLVDNSLATRGLGWDTLGMGEPPELTPPLDTLKMMWGLRSYLRFFVGRAARPAAEYAQQASDPWLRWIIANLFLPEAPAWFLFMVLGMLAGGKVGLLESGSLGFVLPIEKRYKALGGQVTYQATVEQILVEEGRAVGVRLVDGSEHRAGAVISAADGYSTLFGMLGDRYVDAKTQERFETWPLIRPAVMVSLGVDRDLSDVPWLFMIKLQEPILVGEEAIEQITLRVFNYSDRFAPPGKTVLQASFETTWDHWSGLREAGEADYRAEKERVAAEVIERLETQFHGLSAQVEMTDVATPYTTWRYTRNHRGAYMGWLPTPRALLTTLPRTLPGLADFTMAGQWVLPGGGVPPSLFSGRHAIQLLCRRDGRPFVRSVA